jgi:hypothetical protein
MEYVTGRSRWVLITLQERIGASLFDFILGNRRIHDQDFQDHIPCDSSCTRNLKEKVRYKC